MACGSYTSSFPPLHVASLHFSFRDSNLTFSGERAWDPQTSLKRFSKAASPNLTGTQCLESSCTQKAPDPPLGQAASQLERHVQGPLQRVRAKGIAESYHLQCLILQIKKQNRKERKEFSQGHTVSGRVGLESTSRCLLRQNYFFSRLLCDGHSQNNYQS